ncbi:MAG: C-GCAxxG-C-C family protein, partial [Chloroflexota bacterium]
MTKKIQYNQQHISRRGFLTGAGVALTGGVLTLSACGTQSAKAPEWPFKYVKLETEVIRKKGHLGYYEAQCAYGVFWSILDELQQKAGYPFTQIPANMLYYGASGVAGWATLCGALNGAFAAINLVTDNEGTNKLTHELLGWYSTTS